MIKIEPIPTPCIPHIKNSFERILFLPQSEESVFYSEISLQ